MVATDLTQLERATVAWDGKSHDAIVEVYNRYGADPPFVQSVLQLISRTECQPGATWLLKAWVQAGGRLNQQDTSQLVDALGALTGWQAKLHILQCLPFVVFDASHKQPVAAFLRSNLTEANAFVRAWSYGGFVELARQHPDYQMEVERLVTLAMRDESAAVKARLRNALKH
ncbi:MAG: hypothetical protein SV583_03320 [Pseudomonadota bacterium]|nr:hypothetical protein [Pseudomonadota bacterium]